MIHRRVPRVLIAIVVVALALGGGMALGYWMADDLHKDSVVSGPLPRHEPSREAGGQVIQDLLDRKAINEATPIEPEGRWASVFKLDRAEGVIRFRDDSEGRVVQWECSWTAEGRKLDAAIREVSQARGFKRATEPATPSAQRS